MRLRVTRQLPPRLSCQGRYPRSLDSCRWLLMEWAALDIAATPSRSIGSPYLTGVPLARFPCLDSLEGPDRYGALATSRDRRRERR